VEPSGIVTRNGTNKTKHFVKYSIMDMKENFLIKKPVVKKRLFSCDICGIEKNGKIFPVLDENYNKQYGLVQCEDCFKKGCGID